MSKAIFIAATGQHVGKTTTCLGLMSALRKKIPRVGFIKPVGQMTIKIGTNQLIDKDVALFYNHFKLPYQLEDMSPIIFPKGFTRDFLDKKISTEFLEKKIIKSYHNITTDSDFTVVEGTGHTGVGSIIGFNNAQVAKLLKIPAVLVVKGGLGSAFDLITLNKALFDMYEVPIKGIVINQMIQEKETMILEYLKKALAPWKIPILGSIPFDDFLSTLSMQDLCCLFKAHLLSGSQHIYRHFESIRMVATPVKDYKRKHTHNQLIITSSTRKDIIMACIQLHKDYRKKIKDSSLEGGIVLTGKKPPSESILKALEKCELPSIYIPLSNYQVMEKITSHTAKIREEDLTKVDKAQNLVEQHLDIAAFLRIFQDGISP